MSRAHDETLAAILAIPLELQRLTADLQAGLAQFQGTSRIDAARSVPAGTAVQVSTGAERLVGWALRATSAGPVTLYVRNGRDVEAPVVAVVDVMASTSSTKWFGPGGISCPDGVYLQRVGAGQLEGAVWFGVVD